MKKNTLVLLWIAISLMFFGGILAVSTYAISGGNIGVYYQNGAFNSFKKERGSATTQTVEFSDIHSIAIDSDVGKIKIIPGETGGKFIVNYSYPSKGATVSCSADGGIIKFTSIYREQISGSTFTLFSLEPLESNYYGVTITYPQDTVFSAIHIVSSLDNINIEQVEADKIDIKSDLGQIYCDNIVTKSFNSDTEVGNTRIVNSRLGKAEIETNLGEITADNITTSSLDISSEAGNIKVAGALSGKTEIENGLGNISVESTLPRTDYNLDLEVEFGIMKLDGQHESNRIKEHNGAENTMQLQGDAGNISLDFK